jgi:hypothetical protein
MRFFEDRCVQPMPHVRRRHHPREPEELDRGAEPDDGCRRSQEASRDRHSLDDPGRQAFYRGLRSAAESVTYDQEQFNQMTEPYPHWIAN